MPRVFALLVFAVVAVLAFGLLSQPRGRHRDTFRPRRRVWPDSKPASGAGADRSDADTVQVVDATELEGVRDALTSASIDPGRAIFRCNGCRAFYQADSLAALEQSNRGRCLGCGGTDLAAVTVAYSRPA